MQEKLIQDRQFRCVAACHPFAFNTCGQDLSDLLVWWYIIYPPESAIQLPAAAEESINKQSCILYEHLSFYWVVSVFTFTFKVSNVGSLCPKDLLLYFSTEYLIIVKLVLKVKMLAAFADKTETLVIWSGCKCLHAFQCLWFPCAPLPSWHPCCGRWSIWRPDGPRPSLRLQCRSTPSGGSCGSMWPTWSSPWPDITRSA